MFSSGFLNSLYIIPILAILILVHEWGHFWAARKSGVKVEEFGIGIPPRIKGWTRNGVIWSINAIPFGGFVRVKGEDGQNMESDSMNAQPPSKRAFFLTAGIVMNILLAVVLMIFVVGFRGIPHQQIYVSSVVPGSPAAKAGWLGGDRIEAINGKEIDSTQQVSNATADNAGSPMTVTIERRGKLIDTTVVPRKNPPKGQGRVGINLTSEYQGLLKIEGLADGSPAALAGLQVGDTLVSINSRPATDFFVVDAELNRYQGGDAPVVFVRDGVEQSTTISVPIISVGSDVYAATGLSSVYQTPTFEKVPLLEVVPRGFTEAYKATVQMLGGLKQMFSSRENLSQIAGPIGMGQMTSELVSKSPLPLWVVISNISIVLSLNLAFLNLLPLPALDGGRLLFVLIEVLRGGKRIAPEKEGLVHITGFVLLIGLMFFIGFLDINRLVGGGSFLP